MKYKNIREEELKNKVAQDYFWIYDCTKIIGNVDFSVCMHQNQTELFDQESLLWAEAKKGASDIYKSIVQLILTIGKARTFDKFLPPAMLGAFDGEKIAFIPYNDIHEVFYINDFNWNVTPSNHETKEFKLIHDKVTADIDTKALLFNFINDDKELKKFIKKNFVIGKFGLTKTKIDKNNFMIIYNKWLQNVKPTVEVNWTLAKENGIIDGDFYLADLLSQENNTLKEKLYVLLKHDHYELDRKINESGLFSHSTASFNDKQVAHTQFWNKYDRPPREEYWDYIVERRDLLVPQDIRERKGSYFTPEIWVELSQNYLTDVLGEDWQDEYYIWDCAAGTGNLLTGLTNKYNIWASTLDNQDVEVIHDRIKNGANLLDDHVFQFDFLNDDFSKLPIPLREIINNKEKRRKLIIYINPPYAEAGTKSTIAGQGESKANVASDNKIYDKYHKKFGTAARQLYAQFFIRVFMEIPDCTMAHFSTLKLIQAQNYLKYRQHFSGEFMKGFVVPANTFDNVKGHFPIGFFIWKLKKDKQICTIDSDVYDLEGYKGVKTIYTYEKGRFAIDWLRGHFDKEGNGVGYLRVNGPDVQNNIGVFLTNMPSDNDVRMHFIQKITQTNIFQMVIYFSVRHSIDAGWLNDSDQFTYPNKMDEIDTGFRNDCLVYAIFSGQNKITGNGAVNHWIPFSEKEVNSREKFESNFLYNIIRGKITSLAKKDLFSGTPTTAPLEFSEIAQTVLDTGMRLWSYYHKQPNCNVNASLYDIRAYFKGRDEVGRMKNNSNDEKYTELDNALKERIKILGERIKPQAYKHEFLK